MVAVETLAREEAACGKLGEDFPECLQAAEEGKDNLSGPQPRARTRPLPSDYCGPSHITPPE